jgi:hypothetical protein
MDGESWVGSSSRWTEKVWFSGSFRYYIPDTGSSQWTTRARAALFGVLPTPELIWSVVPWSWLFNWFSNYGDIVSNFSENAVENLTCEYSFIMRHYSYEETAFCRTYHTGVRLTYNDGIPWNGWDPMQNQFISTDKLETKSRCIGGNPYGLDAGWSGLSPRQVGVLTALGYTRS